MIKYTFSSKTFLFFFKKKSNGLRTVFSCIVCLYTYLKKHKLHKVSGTSVNVEIPAHKIAFSQTNVQTALLELRKARQRLGLIVQKAPYYSA